MGAKTPRPSPGSQFPSVTPYPKMPTLNRHKRWVSQLRQANQDHRMSPERSPWVEVRPYGRLREGTGYFCGLGAKLKLQQRFLVSISSIHSGHGDLLTPGLNDGRPSPTPMVALLGFTTEL